MRDGENEGRRDNQMQRTRKKVIRTHTDLEVYCRAFAASMKFYEWNKSFPTEERYSLTDQERRSFRSVCANLAEAWRKRRYPAAFVSKLSDSEGEAIETQVWLHFAVECGYLNKELARTFYKEYDDIVGMLVNMIKTPNAWIFK